MLEIVLDAVLDTAKMAPFLFLAYVLIEWVEHHHGTQIESALSKGGRWGFVPAAALGCFPQCGFSAMAANLYSSKVITLGTLISVFLVTSDEAVPLMLAVPEKWPQMLGLLAAKLCIGLLAGFGIDFGLRRWLPDHVVGGYTGSAEDCDCHEHVEEDPVAVAALKHTAHILVFVLAFNLALGALVALIGEETLAGMITGVGWMQPLAAAAIGLIPNCAASVLLTQLYLAGSIGFGAVVAGLSTGAGVGLAVLARANRSVKQNLLVVGLLYGIGAGAGLLLQLFVG